MKGKTTLALLLLMSTLVPTAFAEESKSAHPEPITLHETQLLGVNNLEFGTGSTLNETRLFIDILSERIVSDETLELELSNRGIILRTTNSSKEYALSEHPIYLPFDTVVFRTTQDGYKYVPHKYSYIDKSVTIFTKDLNDLVILNRTSELNEAKYGRNAQQAKQLSELGLLDDFKLPTDKVTREDFANIVSLIHGFESKIGGINTLFERGIISEYCGSDPITNEQASLILYRTLQDTGNLKDAVLTKKSITFADQKTLSKQTIEAINYLLKAGVYEANTAFKPTDTLTYQQLTQMLIPYMQQVDTY